MLCECSLNATDKYWELDYLISAPGGHHHIGTCQAPVDRPPFFSLLNLNLSFSTHCAVVFIHAYHNELASPYPVCKWLIVFAFKMYYQTDIVMAKIIPDQSTNQMFRIYLGVI